MEDVLLQSYRGLSLQYKRVLFSDQEAFEKGDTSENASALDKVQHKLLRLVTSFSKFLNESSTYYQDLLVKLESLCSPSKNLEDTNRSELQRHIYRCLLYLGDLARYSEQNTDRKIKDFGIAQRYYERAAFVAPHSGNPHNQLAVLAGYSSAECVAVFYYFRSILAKSPFTGGYENLDILFRKVAKQYNIWHHVGQNSMDSGILDHGVGFNNSSGNKARISFFASHTCTAGSSHGFKALTGPKVAMLALVSTIHLMKGHGVPLVSFTTQRTSSTNSKSFWPTRCTATAC